MSQKHMSIPQRDSFNDHEVDGLTNMRSRWGDSSTFSLVSFNPVF